MLNLIRMNFYHIFHMKATYILILVTLGFCCLLSFPGFSDSEDETNETQMIEEEQQDSEANVGITVDSSQSLASGTTAEAVELFLGSGVLVLFIGIVVTIFTCGERDSGFLKNVYVNANKKYQIHLSKLIPVAVYILVEFAVIFIFFMIVTHFRLGNVGALLPFLFAQFILHIAYGSLSIMIAELFRSSMIAIITNIMISFGFGVSIIGYLGSQLNELLAIKTKYWNYLLTPQISKMTVDMDAQTMGIGLLVGAIFIIACQTVASVLYQRRDIY